MTDQDDGRVDASGRWLDPRDRWLAEMMAERDAALREADALRRQVTRAELAAGFIAIVLIVAACIVAVFGLPAISPVIALR